MPVPFIRIDIDSQGNPQLKSNLTHPGLILGLMEHAKFLMLTKLAEGPPLIQTVNGGVVTDFVLKG